jgi:hypothetical protein
MSVPTFFVYLDEATSSYYYYNTETSETTFDKPETGDFLDPETNGPFAFDPMLMAEQRKSKRKGHHRARSVVESSVPPIAKMIIDVSDFVTNLKTDDQPAAAAAPAAASFFPNPKKLALPSDLQSDIQRFQDANYAERFFSQHRPATATNRKKPTSDLTVFQSDPIKEPLLISLAKNAKKQAVACFKLILTYTAAVSSTTPGGPMAAHKLVGEIMNSPELRDEVYFQLIKQTRENPRPDCCLRTWDLFLIIATLFPSCRDSENWIKAHFAKNARHENEKIADIAQFCYIRFNARCGIGRHPDCVSLQEVGRIPQDLYICRVIFGASIYEQLWHQKRGYPALQVPLVVHQLAEAMIHKDAEKVEGVFRKSGNPRKVQDLEEDVNKGKAALDKADLHDLATLFKSWFVKLPERVVPQECAGALRNAFEANDYRPFVAALPRAHLLCLKYLVGFLQRIAKAEAVTKMNATNLAICFAQVILLVGKMKDQQQALKMSETAHHFTTWVINELDTSDVYPLPPEALVTGAA